MNHNLMKKKLDLTMREILKDMSGKALPEIYLSKFSNLCRPKCSKGEKPLKNTASSSCLRTFASWWFLLKFPFPYSQKIFPLFIPLVFS